MIGLNPKAGVALFSSVEIGIRNINVVDGGRHERTGESHAKLRVKKRNRALGQDDRCIQAKLYKIPLAHKRENTLRRNPSKS